jgi:hypothetical protein
LPPAPSVVRKLPAPASKVVEHPVALPSAPVEAKAREMSPVVKHPPAVVRPLAPERYKIQVTVSREAHDKLRRAQNLLRHVIPNGDPAAIVERALTLLLQDLERRKCATVTSPRESSSSSTDTRHVPAAVKREVWKRDEGCCAFVGNTGQKCAERGFLEYHHVVPFAEGGLTDASNLQLRCRAHNAYEADQWFGPLFVKEARLEYGTVNSVRTEFSR